MTLYNFSDPPNTACITCIHVTKQNAEILYVSHDSDDGSWQFLCGKSEHTVDDGSVVGLGTITKIDPSLNRIADMPTGVIGERKSINDDWAFFRNGNDSE